MNFLILVILLLSTTYTQDIRYVDEVFSDVVKTEDVIYANSPDLPFIFLFEWNTQDIDLDMDIYEPQGDTLTNRPLILFFHSGAFFSGNNELDDMVDLSIASAKRGYVAASVNYRLGLNVLSTYSGERAVYRGMQDASAVIRYFREYHDLYNIDPNKIFIWGSSAGAFIGLHLAYSDDDERPESTFGGSNDPDLGCIDCVGNNYLHNSKPNAVVSCWGAIGDLDWIEQENNIPSIMFHGTSDLVVPHDAGLPFTINIALPLVYGSSEIQNKLNLLEIENEAYIESGEPHEYWGTLNGNWLNGPNEFYDQIKNNAYDFLFNQLDQSSLIGDINNDNTVNVLDIVETVNIILSNQYNENADLNQDGSNNILDIVILVNIIIG